MGINEELVLTAAVKKLVLARAGEIEIKEQARRDGMRTLREDALAKAARGLTSLEEVARVTAADEAGAEERRKARHNA